MLPCVFIQIFLAPRCLSSSLYRYGKDIHGHQKYLCRDCNRQFTLEPSIPRKSSKNYPKCPICGRNTFLWHRYDSYCHFKCNSKLSGHSIKLPTFSTNISVNDFSFPIRASFNRFRFSPHVIFTAIFLYFSSSSSLRQIKALLSQLFCITVSHVSIRKWILHFSPVFKSVSNYFLSNADLNSDDWHADETFIKIQGKDHYLWILLDSETRMVITFYLSDTRDSTACRKFFKSARKITNSKPINIFTDGLESYNVPIAEYYPNCKHQVCKGKINKAKNNIIESFNGIFKN